MAFLAGFGSPLWGYYYGHNDSLIGIFQQDKTIVRGPFTMDLHSPPPEKAEEP